MPHTVYVAKCDEGKYYIGYTECLDKRLSQHNHDFLNGLAIIKIGK